MRISIAVYGSTHSSESPRSALAFARAAIAKGHVIHRVFFYGDGVEIAGASVDSLANDWQEFASDSDTELAVCVAAAQRRGIQQGSSASSFSFVGLGQLAEAAIASDRVIVFPA